jgi:MFS family permease
VAAGVLLSLWAARVLGTAVAGSERLDLVSAGLAGLVLAIAGAGDMISGVFRGTIWNETIPDRLRGRLAGVEMISWSSGPMLGNAEAGIAASLVGLRSSIVGGGLICVLGTVALAAALPRFWHYDARHGADTNVHPDLIEAV